MRWLLMGILKDTWVWACGEAGKGGLGKGKVNQGCLGENLVLCRDSLKGTGLKAASEDGSHHRGT